MPHRFLIVIRSIYIRTSAKFNLIMYVYIYHHIFWCLLVKWTVNSTFYMHTCTLWMLCGYCSILTLLCFFCYYIYSYTFIINCTISTALEEWSITESWDRFICIYIISTPQLRFYLEKREGWDCHFFFFCVCLCVSPNTCCCVSTNKDYRLNVVEYTFWTIYTQFGLWPLALQSSEWRDHGSDSALVQQANLIEAQ